MLKLNDIFFDETAKIIRQLKEAVDKLVKDLQKLFDDLIDEDAYEDAKQTTYKDTKQTYKDTKQTMSKYNLNKSKYTRENNYYKNQFRLAKRHVCIRNKYKR